MQSEALAPRRTMLVTGFSLGAILMLAATAWACTIQPQIELSPDQGRPGQVVTIRLKGFVGSAQPIQIRWDSVEGSIIADAAPGSESVQVTIPATETGWYTVVATQERDVESQNLPPASARASFRVAGPRIDGSRPDTPSGGGGESRPAVSKVSTAATTGALPNGEAGRTQGERVPTSFGQTAFATSGSTGSRVFDSPQVPARNQVGAGGVVWQPFDARPAPSLLGALDEGMSAPGGRPLILMWHAGLLGAGLVALFGSFLVADLRRHSARARRRVRD